MATSEEKKIITQNESSKLEEQDQGTDYFII